MNIQLTHDYSDFNPEGFAYPPNGFYAMAVVDAKSDKKSEEKGGYAFITLTFEITDGDQKGQRFKMDYNTGYPKHKSEKAAIIAMENIGRIYYGATGERPGRNGLNIKDLMNKTFGANLIVEEKAKTDGSGGSFKNSKLNGIQFLNNQPVEQTAAPTSNSAAPANKDPWTK